MAAPSFGGWVWRYDLDARKAEDQTARHIDL